MANQIFKVPDAGIVTGETNNKRLLSVNKTYIIGKIFVFAGFMSNRNSVFADASGDFVIDLLERMRPDVVLERFASEAPPRFQAGPTWGLVRNEQLWSRFERRLAERDTYQGKFY